jgi:hypothetical protein
MEISGSSFLSNLYGVGGIGAAGTSGTAASGTRFDPARVALADAYTRAADLGAALTELDRLVSAAEPRRTRAAQAGSAANLNLDVAALTATTLRSSEEVNATATSFTPFGPDYIEPADSTALATISGIYDGSNGTGTLTFDARRTGVHGEDDLRFRLRDADRNRIDRFWVRDHHPIDREYTLSNGLVFTLGEGYSERNDKFTIEVFADVGSVVDPDKAFNGLRNDNPNLQYGLTVTDGSFEINGETIVVNASDSINDVLARISASAADVSAVFDAATEQLVLTRSTPGAAFDITLANDTSGFLQATKLDTATAVPGTDGNADSPIGDLPQFASVTSGSVKINDVEIALDVSTDSLSDILERISASDAFVSARIINDRVYLQGMNRRDMMTLDDNGTGLFSALNIQPGRYMPVARDGVGQTTAQEIAAATAVASIAVDRLYGGVSGVALPAQAAGLQAQVKTILGAAESALNDSTRPLGLAFDPAALNQGSRMTLDDQLFSSNLRVNFSEVKAALLGETADAREGFVRQLLDVVNQFTAGLRGQFGDNGFLAGLSA